MKSLVQWTIFFTTVIARHMKKNPEVTKPVLVNKFCSPSALHLIISRFHRNFWRIPYIALNEAIAAN